MKMQNAIISLTAGHVQCAGLLIQGEEGQVHRAGAGDRDSEIISFKTGQRITAQNQM